MSQPNPYQILEVANTHGGDLNYVLDLVSEFKDYQGYGMKFQPLHPDKIATPNFSWYPVYKELFFTPEDWRKIIIEAKKTKDIWLDIFDIYGVDIFHDNQNDIKGVKLQSSILFNEEVIARLGRGGGLKDHILIINISGYEVPQVWERIGYFLKRLSPADLWIEVGFQAYPTELQDSGYIKIKQVKETFGRKVVFADHADGKSEDAIWLPILAALNQADGIEKHICHSKLETKYDFYSSIDRPKYDQYISKLQSYLSLNDQPFINQRERQYLEKSIQVPIALHELPGGSLVDLTSDLQYRRSGNIGLSTPSITAIQKGFHILATNVNAGSTLLRHNFKKANIATIIACRLKSSRLPKKALLKIGTLSSVEKCIASCKRILNVNHTILATSDLPEDSELRDYCFDSSVIFHTGDPEDVIRRYLSIADQLRIDVIIRVTADCPFISDEIVAILLDSHFASGADYTAAKESAVGTAAEIINVTAMRKVKEHFPNANYSEYMTWYFQNNPEHFKLNIVPLPNDLVRAYRLTLDYQEDLDMFNKVEAYLIENKMNGSIREIFDFLDHNPNVAQINGHLTLKYKADQSLIDTLNRVTRISTKSLEK